MSLFSALKRNARLALRGSWGRAIAALLIFFGAGVLIQALQQSAISIFTQPAGGIDPSIAIRYGINEYFFRSLLETTWVEAVIVTAFVLLTVLLIGPLRLGMMGWFYSLVSGRGPGVGEMFRCFETGAGYRRAVWYNINITVRVWLWTAALCAIPGGILGVSGFVLSTALPETPRSTTAMASVGMLLGTALMALAGIFLLAVVNRYALVPFLLTEDDSLGVRDAIRQSVRFSRGYRFSLVWLGFSFIGWLLLCGLTLGLMMLYVLPYMLTTHAMYARYIIERGRSAAAEATQEFVMEQPPRQEPPAPPEAAEDPSAPRDPFSFPPRREAPGEDGEDGLPPA